MAPATRISQSHTLPGALWPERYPREKVVILARRFARFERMVIRYGLRYDDMDGLRRGVRHPAISPFLEVTVRRIWKRCYLHMGPTPACDRTWAFLLRIVSLLVDYVSIILFYGLC